MAQNKTTENKNSVPGFLKTIADEKKRKDCSAIIKMIGEQTGFEPKMWGPAIIGFGSYHYKYESGREGDAPLAALAARANAITIYLAGFEGREAMLAKLGKHKITGGCLYIQKLEDIDTGVLMKMVKKSMVHTKKKYPG